MDAFKVNVVLFFWGLFWKETSYFTLVGKLEKRAGVTGDWNEGSRGMGKVVERIAYQNFEMFGGFLELCIVHINYPWAL